MGLVNATPYLLITVHPDGTRTSAEHPSKTSAHDAGRKARAAGHTVFAHTKASAVGAVSL